MSGLWSKVQAECKGLPLALKVIGSSLHGEPRPGWESAKNTLLNGVWISNYHKEGLLRCLESSIDVLDEEAQECFLDLGPFRRIEKYPWMHYWTFGFMCERWSGTMLLSSSWNRKQESVEFNKQSQESNNQLWKCFWAVLFSAWCHARLALYLASNQHVIDNLIYNQHVIGAMEEDQWCEINFRQAEALVLNFSTSIYFLPSFLSSMKKLKILIVLNYGSKRTTVNGLPAPSSVTQLRTVRLERLNVPPLQEHSSLSELGKNIFELMWRDEKHVQV